MEEKYYLVRQRLHKSLLLPHPAVFVSVSEGKLEHLIGDQVLFSLLELRGGELKMKKEALCTYDIYPLNKSQLDWRIMEYGELLRQKRGGRILSAR